ncbi:MAG: hypothetical protein ACO22Z_06730, partial [Paracoccaceae bacterium]
RCAQTAHISLQISDFQRAIFGQNFQRALFPSASSKALSSDFPNRCYYLRRRFSPSPSLCRFGEAVFTVGRRKPQGQKTPAVTFFLGFLFFPRNLGVGGSFGTSGSGVAQFCFRIRARLGGLVSAFSRYASAFSAHQHRGVPAKAMIPPIRWPSLGSGDWKTAESVVVVLAEWT